MSETRILLVEDDQDLAELVRASLGGGHEYLHATNGLEGLQLALEGQPDLIISDIMMPHMNGHEFIERLRKDPTFNETPVIFLSALGSGDNIRKGYELGAALYMTKPLEPGRFKRNVELFIKDHGITSKKKQRALGSIRAGMTYAPEQPGGARPQAPKPASTPSMPGYRSGEARPKSDPKMPGYRAGEARPKSDPHMPGYRSGESRPASSPRMPGYKPAEARGEAPVAGRPASSPRMPGYKPAEGRPASSPRMPAFRVARDHAPESREAEAPQASKIRLLLADPDTAFVDRVRREWEAAYEVLPAADGIEAMERAARYNPDIFIIDGNIPKMSGYQLVMMLRKNAVYKNAPIIFTTDKTEPRDQQYIEKLGVHYILSRPFDVASLQNMVARAASEPGFSVKTGRMSYKQCLMDMSLFEESETTEGQLRRVTQVLRADAIKEPPDRIN